MTDTLRLSDPSFVPVQMSQFLEHDGRIRRLFGALYAHCPDCMKKAVADINAATQPEQRANE